MTVDTAARGTLARVGAAILANPAVVLFVVVTIALAVQTWRLRAEQDRAGALALRAYNDSAALDTSRRVRAVLGDSLAAVTKLAIQHKLTADGLDKALGVVQMANVALQGTITALTATQVGSTAPVVTTTPARDTGTTAGTTSTTAASGDVRTASWHVRHEPYTADITASLPASGLGVLDSLRVAIDTATVTLRLGCAETPNADGIRSARVTATGPVWLPLTITKAAQDPGVCPSPALGARHAGAWWPTIGIGLSVKLRRVTDTVDLSTSVLFWHWTP